MKNELLFFFVATSLVATLGCDVPPTKKDVQELQDRITLLDRRISELQTELEEAKTLAEEAKESAESNACDCPMPMTQYIVPTIPRPSLKRKTK